MKRLYGNTFEIKDLIKSKGGKWNADQKCWYIPDEHFDELDKLIPARQFTCEDCGDYVCSGTECWETGLTH